MQTYGETTTTALHQPSTNNGILPYSQTNWRPEVHRSPYVPPHERPQVDSGALQARSTDRDRISAVPSVIGSTATIHQSNLRYPPYLPMIRTATTITILQRETGQGAKMTSSLTAVVLAARPLLTTARMISKAAIMRLAAANLVSFVLESRT